MMKMQSETCDQFSTANIINDDHDHDHKDSEGNDNEANDVNVDANDENTIGVMRTIFNCK